MRIGTGLKIKDTKKQKEHDEVLAQNIKPSPFSNRK